MDSLLKSSSSCLSELQKCKTEIRQVKAIVEKPVFNAKPVDLSELERFQKNATPLLDFVHDNQSKMLSLLHGERDQCPNDMGKQIDRETT